MIKQTLKSSHNLRPQLALGVQSDVKTASRNLRFICPECGSEATDPPPGAHGFRRTVVCAVCHFEIPLHLGERWGRLSLDEAKKEWRELYREDGVLYGRDRAACQATDRRPISVPAGGSYPLVSSEESPQKQRQTKQKGRMI